MPSLVAIPARSVALIMEESLSGFSSRGQSSFGGSHRRRRFPRGGGFHGGGGHAAEVTDTRFHPWKATYDMENEIMQTTNLLSEKSPDQVQQDRLR